MVKILAVDLFQSGGILPIGSERGSEPIAVASTSNFVIVASRNGLITFYDAETGEVQCCFKSRGVITRLWFSEVTGALFTVELVAREDTNEEDYVFPRNQENLSQWKVRSGPSTSSPIVAKLETGERFIVTHREGPWIRVRLRREGGHVVGWTRSYVKDTIYLHKTTDQRPRAMPRLYYNWDRGTTQNPANSQMVRQVEMIGSLSTGKKEFRTVFEDNLDQRTTVSVLFMDHPDNEVGQLSVCPSTGNVAVSSRDRICVHQVELVNGFPIVTKLYSLVPKCEDIVQLTLCQEFIGYASQKEAYALRIRLTDNEIAVATPHEKASKRQDSDVTESIVADDAKLVSLEFDSVTGKPSEGSSVYSIKSPFAHHWSSSDVSEKSEVLGPLTVADQGVCGAPECGFWVSSCDCYLYKSFRDSGMAIHTLSLLPAHTERLADLCNRKPQTGKASTSPLLPSGDGISNGVCCFLSHELSGYMYGFVRGATRLLTSYSYTQPSNCAAISDYLLFVTAAGDIGHVEAYTIRNVVDMDREDRAIETLDVSLFGKKNIFSPAAVEVGDRNVVVLVKHTEQKVDTLKRGTDAHESNFNVYALRTCGLDDLFNMIVAVGEEYRGNWPYFYQVLLEAHQLLRAQVGALTRNRFIKNQKGIEEHQSKFKKYTQLLRDSCVLLANHLVAKRDLDWQNLMLYFTASHLLLSEVVSKLIDRRPSLKNSEFQMTKLVDDDYNAANCIVGISKSYLFIDSYKPCIDDTPALANLILRLFWHVNYFDLPRVIIRSHLSKYDAEVAIKLLKTIPPELRDEAFERNEDELSLALCVLSLRLSNIDLAAKYVIGLEDYVRNVCSEDPYFLFSSELNDDNFEVIRQNISTVPTPLAKLIGSCNMGLLVSCFTVLHGKVTINTAVSCLLECGSSQSSRLDAVIKYLKVSIEMDAEFPLERKSSLSCLSLLCHFQLKRFQESVISMEDFDNQVVPMTVASHKQRTWLTLLDMKDAELPTNSRAALADLQALLANYLKRENAKDLYDLILQENLPDNRYPSVISLRLLCLPFLDQLHKGQELVLEVCPEALIWYCEAHISERSSDIKDWDWMHKSMLELFGKKDNAKEWTPYRDFLRYVAEVLDPDEFLKMLPNEGSMTFYAPILEHCYRHSQARTITADITKKVGMLS